MIPQKKHPSPWYTAFSLTWLAFMQIYWKKRKRLHKKKVQVPQDLFGTPTWPPFHCFGTPIWPPWRHEKTLYNTRRVARQHELSYQGHPKTFFCKISCKEQILPRNLSNLGKASLFLYPLFSVLRSSSARMKIEIAGIYDRKRILGIFLGVKGNSKYSLSSEEVCGAWLAMKFSTAVSLCKVNEPSNRM